MRTKKSVDTSQSIQFYSVNEVLDMPAPKWLIKGFMTQGSVALLYGNPGVGKSFVAIDIGLSVAKGKEWFNSMTSQGAVVMVSTEGNQSLQLRLKGWEIENDMSLSDTNNFIFCFEPIDFSKTSAQQNFLKKMKTLPEQPKLIIIDTFADCFSQSSNSENDSGSVSKFLGGIKRIVDKTGASALIVHHNNKGARKERGSTAIRGKMDSMYLVTSSKAGFAVIDSTKQRNFAVDKKIQFSLKEVNLPELESEFSLATTCVAVLRDGTVSAVNRPAAMNLTKNQQIVLELLAQGSPLKQLDIRQISGLSKSSLSDTMKKLVELKLVSKFGDFYHITTAGTKCSHEFGSGDINNPPEPNERTSEHLVNRFVTDFDEEDVSIAQEEDFETFADDDWGYEPDDDEEPF
jgi:predicted ATP-dependent serine protease